MILFRFVLMAVIMCAFFAPNVSYAADSIPFIKKNDFKDTQIKNLLSEQDFNKIAAIDLNEDSIDEYVLERDFKGALRAYELLALIDEQLIPLGIIRAEKLMLAYDQQHGVRSILSFKDANNDYEYEVYAWDAMRSRYSNIKDIETSGGAE